MTRCSVFAWLTLANAQEHCAWRRSEGSLRCHTVRDLVREVVPQDERQHEPNDSIRESRVIGAELEHATREQTPFHQFPFGYMRTTGSVQHEKRSGPRRRLWKRRSVEKSKSRLFHLAWKSRKRTRDSHFPHSLDYYWVLSACGLTGSGLLRPEWCPFSPALTWIGPPSTSAQIDV
jgi:hypothetical protein